MTKVSPANAGRQHAADRLLAAIERVGSPVCVGIDPVLDRLPAALRAADCHPDACVAAIRSFSLGVLDAVAPHAACVKFQSACFERYGAPGVDALQSVIEAARERDLQVVLDAKRGDISLSAQHYAHAAFGEPGTADWLTINSYFGDDGIRPFLQPGHGLFALVRTSNPGGDRVQAARLQDGRTVAELVAALVAEVGAGVVGDGGYSAVGAVVAATKPDETAALRALMPQQIFLVPGFGAQGGDAESVRSCFAADGRGAIVTASRSVIYAFSNGQSDWMGAVGDAAALFAEQVAGIGPG
jgi:orotidine-5'-phosphate decarboxylase